ncbi:M23 family metallopeptidase [Phocicoccus pinnipedialis]|uniref:Peptidase family M23 n=1 Tax=Phocicoccus pinnipedialis TaxID=110845 RepID=A0A6V7R882_9BACL|nr:M23 family metallopeptidase [Jeotgalicoccus pinnipedialis]MBP1938936.1 murein DD-endopeptidase MepM/ murein hydrolase activator NlpD [Jeotgalicoccus pinnipedialis]CAD2073224.1 Peptidase family M23 [Jeotgalicoccus pinnipedialis]
MNPIEYLKHQGFKVTSDPNQYASGIFGLRNYTVNGYNFDYYCGGFHRAYDLVKFDGAKVPAVMSGEIVTGTRTKGNFGATVVVANREFDRQIIYGHLKENLCVKIGDQVHVGDTIGYQGNTNYYGVNMASHLHIQFQKYGYLKEQDFVCSGIDCKDINILKDKIKGIFVSAAPINMRKGMSVKSTRIGSVHVGFQIRFKNIEFKEGHYWIEGKRGKDVFYIAIGDVHKIWGKIKML